MAKINVFTSTLENVDYINQIVVNHVNLENVNGLVTPIIIKAYLFVETDVYEQSDVIYMEHVIPVDNFTELKIMGFLGNYSVIN